MSDSTRKENPKWPDSLPPFTEMTLLPPEHVIYREELVSTDDISNLVHDLFYFPEDKHFLYFEYGSNDMPEGFDSEKLKAYGLAFRKHENFFYRRPLDDTNPEDYSYIQLTIDKINYPWQQKIVDAGPMYGRVQIELMEWKKKEIELQRIKSVHQNDNNPLLLQPNFMGLGIDLKKLLKWGKNIFRKKV